MAQPLILFGAFDRHNFGDLLLPHIAAALLPERELIFAGLAARDLRAHGGHAVRALSEVRTALGTQPVDLLHVGGEILTTTAWQAAVMLLPPDEVQATLAYLQAQPQEQAAWVQDMTGSAGQAPYVTDRTHWPALQRVLYAGVGGVQLAQSEPGLRAEVLAKLRAADAVGVRDVQTQRTLQAAGIDATLLPDPAVLVAELFGERITQHGAQGEVAPLRQTFPQGYLAVQCSAEFGDDTTLNALAAQLKQVAAACGLGLLLLRAGAAPWHDDLGVLQRLATRLAPATVQVAESLNVWDICALIAHSRGYCGSSLHGRIVAMAYALPRINLRPPASPQQAAKQAAFAATWDDANVPATVDVPQLADAMQQALALPSRALQDTADRLAAQYRRGFEALRTQLT
ncbi:MAG: polysaccharide pyruvyl transferase family protein [Hylemonella sp.]|nr:polysaccharide pyruvyl transferase family protein [Hylemonella sp.]